MLKDVLGPEKAKELMEDLGEIIESFRILGWKEVRPWPEFFGAFKSPKWDFKNVEQRTTTNLLHYRSNYLLIVSALVLVRILFAPAVLFSILICVAFTVYFTHIFKYPLRIGDYKFDQNGKIIASSIVSFLFLGVTGALEQLIWALVLSTFLCLAHMVFRPRNVSSKANKVYEDTKLSTVDWFGTASTSTSTSSGGSGSGSNHHRSNDLDDLEGHSSSADDLGEDINSTSMGSSGVGFTSASVRKRPTGTKND